MDDEIASRLDAATDDAIAARIESDQPSDRFATARQFLAGRGTKNSLVASSGEGSVFPLGVKQAAFTKTPTYYERMMEEQKAADEQHFQETGSRDKWGQLLGVAARIPKALLDARSAGDAWDRTQKTTANALRSGYALLGDALRPATTLVQMKGEKVDQRVRDTDNSLAAGTEKAINDFFTGRFMLQGGEAIGGIQKAAEDKLVDMGMSRDTAFSATSIGSEILPLAAIKIARTGRKMGSAYRAGKLAREIDDAAARKPIEMSMRELAHNEMVRRIDIENKFDQALDHVRKEQPIKPDLPEPTPVRGPNDPPVIQDSILWDNPAMRWTIPLFGAIKDRAHRWGFGLSAAGISDEFASRLRQWGGARDVIKADARADARAIKRIKKNLTEDQKHHLRDFIAGLTDDVSDLPDHVIEYALREKGEIFGLTEAQVERGIVSREVANETNNGYLARMYENDLDGIDKVFPKVRPEGVPLGIEYPHIRRDRPALVIKGIPHEQIEALTEGFQTDLARSYGKKGYLIKFKKDDIASRDAFIKQLSDPVTRERLGITGKAGIKKLEQLTPEQLKDLGEMLDPEVPLVVTKHRQRARVVDHDYLESLQDMSADGIGPLVLEDADMMGKAPEGYTKVVRDGPLKDKYLADPVLDQLDDFFNLSGTKGDPGWFSEFFQGLNAGLKFKMTVGSPRTAMRQLYSVPYFVGYGGVKSLKQFPEAIRSFREGSKAHAKWDRLFKQYNIDAGAQFTDAEINKALEYIRPKKGGTRIPIPGTGRTLPEFGPRQLGGFIGAPWAQTNVGKFAGRIYNLPDVTTRRALFIHYVDDLGMSPARAAVEVNKWTPNYAEVGKTIDTLRKAPLGAPFFTFRAEMYRIQANALREKPLMLALQMYNDRLIKGVVGYTLGDLMGAFGEDDELLEKEREALRLTKGEAPFPVGRDDQGRLRTHDLSFVDPNTETRDLAIRLADLVAEMFGGNIAANDHRDLDLWEDGVRDAAGYVGVDASPVLNLATKGILGMDLQSGQRVDDRGRAMAQEILPGLTPNYGRDALRFQAARAGKQPSRYRPVQDPFSAFLDSMFGLTATPVDWDLEEERIANRMKTLMGREKSRLRFNDSVFTGQDINEDEVENNMEKVATKAGRQLDALDAIFKHQRQRK